MNRRDFALTLGSGVALASLAKGQAAGKISLLKPLASGPIPVAFLISDGAVVIDFCGPWAVLGNVFVPGREGPAFKLHTVAETTKPIDANGLMVTPQYTYDNAPPAKVIVIPAQSADNEATLNWIRKASQTADLTMSVCTGAFLLAKTGLLNGKAATTHHGSYGRFGMSFKEIKLKRGYRFVDSGNVATAGGLTSGIDLAFHLVERYYGRTIAENSANYMEYQGTGWLDSSGASNKAYADASNNPYTDPVCGMILDEKATLKVAYKGKTYYFCSNNCKANFEGDPEGTIQAITA